MLTSECRHSLPFSTTCSGELEQKAPIKLSRQVVKRCIRLWPQVISPVDICLCLKQLFSFLYLSSELFSSSKRLMLMFYWVSCMYFIFKKRKKKKSTGIEAAVLLTQSFLVSFCYGSKQTGLLSFPSVMQDWILMTLIVVYSPLCPFYCFFPSPHDLVIKKYFDWMYWNNCTTAHPNHETQTWCFCQ